ncbi:unnamed protein product [Vitrella brassicaformis CCMP3155]|uniref:Sugar phosphate transporter domain-containing protein n=1 Tax=Vitrella brassicaformis (strain CCMP3155) TaxID=1169540 RepID=A0A0G4G2H6_VITBC|nr:unnamed protein product [Vitrella brassicaformis CCMP3155]|eukprot:CEM22468.1 unnamed protein product [Vitrella brassicaformis CCMP3155]
MGAYQRMGEVFATRVLPAIEEAGERLEAQVMDGANDGANEGLEQLLRSAEGFVGGGGQYGATAKVLRRTQMSPLRKHADAMRPLLMSTETGDSATTIDKVDIPKTFSTAPGKKSDLGETLKTGTYFALWYAFNILYNIYNKQALNVLPNPWSVAWAQMFIGIPLFLPLWLTGIRKAPKLKEGALKTLIPQGLFHTGTHVGAVVALGAGAVSFAHIVKAAEPVFTAGLSAAVLGQYLSPITYSALIPVVAGVGLASAKELSFTWTSFGFAMLSNISSSLRGIFGKKTMSDPKAVGENLTAANQYSLLTIISCIALLPLSAFFEYKTLVPNWQAAVANGVTDLALAKLVVLSGIFYYLYNEVAFLALSRVNPVTHAVGNTMKRVVIILASIVVFRNPITPLGAIGSGVAILGTLLYSLAKQKFG